MSQPIEAPKNAMQRLLDVVEKVGNKVPHPVIIFLVLIAIVILLSHIFWVVGTAEEMVGDSLRAGGGIRFMYDSVGASFMSLTGLGLIIDAMTGVGVAEQAGVVNALIRKLAIVSPRWALAYILALVVIVSSI